jgi:hypothetical protein
MATQTGDMKVAASQDRVRFFRCERLLVAQSVFELAHLRRHPYDALSEEIFGNGREAAQKSP